MVRRTRGRSSGGVEVNKRGEERTQRRGGEGETSARDGDGDSDCGCRGRSPRATPAAPVRSHSLSPSDSPASERGGFGVRPRPSAPVWDYWDAVCLGARDT